MSAILIVPFLESLGLTEVITTGAEAIGLGSYSTVAGTAATGLIASEIAAPIDQKAIDYYKKNYEGTATYYFNTVKAVLNQDTKFFIDKDRMKKAAEKQSNQENILPAGAKPISKIIPNFNDLVRMSDKQTTDKYPDVIINPSLGDPRNIIKPIKKVETGGVKTTQETQQNLQNTTPMYNQLKQLDPYDFFDTSPRALARYVIDVSRRVASTKNLKEATFETLELEPEIYTLSQKVGNFMTNKSLPNTDEFKVIKQIFNGRNINKNSFTQRINPSTGLIEVSGTNELGQILTLPQTTGFVLPAVAGTIFMGPNSKNNRVPKGCLPGEVERVEDYFSFFHDYSWRNGSFNRIGDLQFISRLYQNMDRVLPQYRKLVRSTIIYFSNISLNLSMFVQQPEDDIFSVLGGIDKSDPNYSRMKNEFYEVLSQELTSYTKTDGFLINANNMIKEDTINNMEIQLN